MRFLANEYISSLTVAQLRSAGYEIDHVRELMSGATDEAVIEQAFATKSIVITFDKEYGDLIFRNAPSPPLGVVLMRFDPVSVDEVASILALILSDESVQLEGKFTILTRQSIRQRNLH